MEKTHVYELVNHAEGDKVVATFWWDGRYVKSDNPDMLESFKRMMHMKFRHSESWLQELPRVFRNGYLMARKAKK